LPLALELLELEDTDLFLEADDLALAVGVFGIHHRRSLFAGTPHLQVKAQSRTTLPFFGRTPPLFLLLSMQIVILMDLPFQSLLLLIEPIHTVFKLLDKAGFLSQFLLKQLNSSFDSLQGLISLRNGRYL
jgi:hypothetical protein